MDWEALERMRVCGFVGSRLGLELYVELWSRFGLEVGLGLDVRLDLGSAFNTG